MLRHKDPWQSLANSRILPKTLATALIDAVRTLHLVVDRSMSWVVSLANSDDRLQEHSRQARQTANIVDEPCVWNAHNTRQF